MTLTALNPLNSWTPRPLTAKNGFSRKRGCFSWKSGLSVRIDYGIGRKMVEARFQPDSGRWRNRALKCQDFHEVVLLVFFQKSASGQRRRQRRQAHRVEARLSSPCSCWAQIWAHWLSPLPASCVFSWKSWHRDSDIVTLSTFPLHAHDQMLTNRKNK